MTSKRALSPRTPAQYDTRLLDTPHDYSIVQQFDIEQRLYKHLMRNVSTISDQYENYAAAARQVLDNMTFEQQLALDQDLHPEYYI